MHSSAPCSACPEHKPEWHPCQSCVNRAVPPVAYIQLKAAGGAMTSGAHLTVGSRGPHHSLPRGRLLAAKPQLPA